MREPPAVPTPMPAWAPLLRPEPVFVDCCVFGLFSWPPLLPPPPPESVLVEGGGAVRPGVGVQVDVVVEVTVVLADSA